MLSTNNSTILSFYNDHPEQDFEANNIFFINMFERFNKECSETTRDFQLKEILMEIQKSKNNSSDLEKIIIQNNNNVQSIISQNNETIIDKTNILFTSLASKNNEHLEEKLKYQLHQELNPITEYLDKQKYNNSSVTGKIGENRLFYLLNECFPNASISDTTGTSKCGDFLLERNCKNSKIMIENKEYSTNVPDCEVRKFIRDIESIHCHGIFFSQNSGIANKNNLEINLHGKYLLIYLHHVNYDKEKIMLAVSILDMLVDKFDFDKIDSKSISQEDLSIIQKEFLNFISHKNKINELVKDFQKSLITSLDLMEFPTITRILSENFSNVEFNQFECEFCGSIHKNKRALSAHQRSCKKAKINIVT